MRRFFACSVAVLVLAASAPAAEKTLSKESLTFGTLSAPSEVSVRAQAAQWLKEQGGVLSRRAGEKDIALRASRDGGTVEEAVPDDLVTALCLSDGMLANLHELAVRCESLFGKGLDLEWAFTAGTLYLLQCRAMTRNR